MNWYQLHFTGGKATGREADYSSQFNAEVKIEWLYTSTAFVVCMPTRTACFVILISINIFTKWLISFRFSGLPLGATYPVK
jgi:hypothetical protein